MELVAAADGEQGEGDGSNNFYCMLPRVLGQGGDLWCSCGL
jgi:hypothetical protein